MEELQLNVRSVDLSAAAEGVWIAYEGGIEFKIARANTPGYRDAIKQMHRQYKHQIEAGTMDEKLSERLLGDLMAEHILVDWKGLKNNGQDFPYSVNAAKSFLKDERYHEIREWIMVQAQNIENYRNEEGKK